MKKILTYFSVVLLLFFVNQPVFSKVKNSLNPYQKELNNLKEKNTSIKMQIDNWDSRVKRQHHKIDFIKNNLYPESEPLSVKGKFNNFLKSIFLGINSRLNHEFKLDEKNAPKIFEQINKFSKKSDVEIDNVYIDFSLDLDELIIFQTRETIVDHKYTFCFDLFLTRKCFESFTKDEFEIALATVFSSIKIFNERFFTTSTFIFSGELLIAITTLCFFIFLDQLDRPNQTLAKKILLFFGAIDIIWYFLLSKFSQKYIKEKDFNILELLDDPEKYLEYVMPFSQEESKKQYYSVINRIKKEIQEKYPERAKELKKETLKYYLKQIGTIKEKPGITKFLKENFLPFPTQNERIGYIKDKIKELKK